MPAKTQPLEQVSRSANHRVVALLNVIEYGSGNEWLTLEDLKRSGSHPFSNSTRRRKIERNQYPAPVKLSPHMCVWRASDIRAWRQDPTAYQACPSGPVLVTSGMGNFASGPKGGKK
jgi:hypothetical protein